jgi:hypothetical protein
MFILSIPLHVYPVMLKCYNRGRVQRVLQRLEARGRSGGEPGQDLI